MGTKVKKDFIPVCTVHDRFQTQNGIWLDKAEEYYQHVVYTCSQNNEEIEGPCDLCDDPKQIDIEFESFSGMMGNNSGEE